MDLENILIIKNTRPSLKDVLEILNKLYGFDITDKSRKRKYIYARKVYFKICRDLQYTFHDVGVAIGYDHATALFHYNSFNVVEVVDFDIYHKALDIVDKLKEIKEEEYSNVIESIKKSNKFSNNQKTSAEYRARISELENELIEIRKNSEAISSIKKLIPFVKEWSEEDLNDFIEFKVIPHSKMLKSRIKPKVFTN